MVRVYFNFRNAEGGRIWSIDDGDQKNEINVKRIVTDVPMESMFNPNAKRGVEPSGFFVAMTGSVTIDPGTETAYIL